MTERKHLKAAVRRRMAKTGESYAAARFQVVIRHRAAPWPDRFLQGWYPFATDAASAVLHSAGQLAEPNPPDATHLLLAQISSRRGITARLLGLSEVSGGVDPKAKSIDVAELQKVLSPSVLAGRAILDRATRRASSMGRRHIATDDMLVAAWPQIDARARALRSAGLDEVALTLKASKALAHLTRSQNRADDTVTPEVRDALVLACGWAEFNGSPIGADHLAAALARPEALHFASPVRVPVEESLRLVVTSALNTAERERVPLMTLRHLESAIRLVQR
jgi:hypothetical protein